MKIGDGNREEFIARASAGKVSRVVRLGGFWWDDNWITPALAYRIFPTEKISEIVIGGWNPDIEGLEDNRLWVGLEDRMYDYPALTRGNAFEFVVPVPDDCGPSFELTLATLAELESDQRDLRARGCHLYTLGFQ